MSWVLSVLHQEQQGQSHSRLQAAVIRGKQSRMMVSRQTTQHTTERPCNKVQTKTVQNNQLGENHFPFKITHILDAASYPSVSLFRMAVSFLLMWWKLPRLCSQILVLLHSLVPLYMLPNPHVQVYSSAREGRASSLRVGGRITIIRCSMWFMPCTQLIILILSILALLLL